MQAPGDTGGTHPEDEALPEEILVSSGNLSEMLLGLLGKGLKEAQPRTTQQSHINSVIQKILLLFLANKPLSPGRHRGCQKNEAWILRSYCGLVQKIQST